MQGFMNITVIFSLVYWFIQQNWCSQVSSTLYCITYPPLQSRQKLVLWLHEIVMKKDRQRCLHDLVVVGWHTFSLCGGFVKSANRRFTLHTNPARNLLLHTAFYSTDHVPCQHEHTERTVASLFCKYFMLKSVTC